MKPSIRTFSATLILPLLLLPVRSGQAQQDEGSVDKRLDQPVTLLANETTVLGLTEDLSKATGLQIECSDPIREKPIVASIRGQSARSVLDAIAEFNGWTWSRVRDGVYRLERKQIKKPDRMIDVAAAIQLALPRDLKEYLHLPKLPKEKRVGGSSFMGLSSYNALIANAAANLRNAIATSTKPGDIRTFTKLSPNQQEELRWVRLFDAVRGLSVLLFDDLNVHHYDFNDVWIQLDNRGRTFGVRFPDPVNRIFGFGIGGFKP
jgi:hypothetical protein